MNTEMILRVHRDLRDLYPDARLALNISNSFELLIAVILSAQCTDVRVSRVTIKRFKKY